MKMRVAVSLAVALLFALPAPAQDRRVVISLEEFLPPDVLAYVAMPDLMTVTEALEQTGDGREALARRLTEGRKIDAGPVSILFEILAAAADAQVTFSLHPGAAGSSGETDFLVSANTARKGDHLETAVRDLMRGYLIPRFGEKVTEEQIGGHKLYHLTCADADFYVVMTRGFVLVSSSPLLLGRVLREMQSPSGKTLAHFAPFAAARREAKKAAGGPHGFLYVPDGSRLPFPARFRMRSASGILMRADGGFRDEVTVRARKGGLFDDLRETPPSASWSALGRDGAWVTASLSPAGVMRLAQWALGGPLSPFAAWLQDVAAGPVEVLVRPDAAPVLRIRLKPDVTEKALRPLKRITRREGDALLISADPKSLEGMSFGDSAWLAEAADGEAPVCLRIKSRLSLLFDAIGATGEGATGSTVWQLRVRERSEDGIAVQISSGLAEAGPFCLALASLLR